MKKMFKKILHNPKKLLKSALFIIIILALGTALFTYGRIFIDILQNDILKQ